MAATSDLDVLASELDEVHAAALRAFRARDLNKYRSFFTEDLRYVQPNGEPIGLTQLMRDVADQLSRFKEVASDFSRESLAINNDGTVTQIVQQHVEYSMRVFFIFTKMWRMKRRGKYTYRKTDGGWQVCRVEVLSETLQ
jgi:ketosteroid isomerase-like protein